MLFAALAGTKGDGAAFVGDAVSRGAAAVLLPVGVDAAPAVPVLRSGDARRALARMAARFYGANPTMSWR